MFLLSERSWVERMVDAKEGEALFREPGFGSFANGIRQQLGNVCHDADGGLADVKKLVDKGQEEAEKEPNGPAANGGTGNGWVILVADNGADFSVRAVAGDESGFEFHLLNQMLMSLGMRKDGFVFEEHLDLHDDGRRKIVVLFVDAVDADHDVVDFFERVLRCQFLGFEQVIFGDVEVVFSGGLGKVIIAIVFIV